MYVLLLSPQSLKALRESTDSPSMKIMLFKMKILTGTFSLQTVMTRMGLGLDVTLA